MESEVDLGIRAQLRDRGGLTVNEIAREEGITPARVRQVLAEAGKQPDTSDGATGHEYPMLWPPDAVAAVRGRGAPPRGDDGGVCRTIQEVAEWLGRAYSTVYNASNRMPPEYRVREGKRIWITPHGVDWLRQHLAERSRA